MDLITLAMAKAYSDSKGGYIEQGKMVFEADLNTAAEFPGMYQESGGRIGLEVGKTYTVQLDSGNYTAVCKEETKDGITARTLGNTSIYGEGEDTGESFLVSEVFTAEESVIVIVDRNQGAHAAIIDHDGETIHPIDPKYIPWDSAPGGGSSGGLPVVELSEETATALFNTGNAVCTAKEAAVFRAAKEALLPVVVAVNLNGMIMSSVALLTTNLGGEDMYRYKMDTGSSYLYFILGADEVSGQLKNE